MESQYLVGAASPHYIRAGRYGASQTLLSAPGFRSSMIAGLVEKGLATITREKVWAAAKLVEVGEVGIKAAGRDALAAEG